MDVFHCERFHDDDVVDDDDDHHHHQSNKSKIGCDAKLRFVGYVGWLKNVKNKPSGTMTGNSPKVPNT